MKTQRIVWLDIAKGIAICLMVLGHTSIPPFLSNFIWAFHMPLFFIASGWTTNWENPSLKIFLKKKFKGLMIPFFIYSMIVFIIESIVGWNTLSHFVCRGWEGYALWFIPVLFFALICSQVILKITSIKLRYILCGGVLLVGCVLSYYRLYFPWAFSSVPFATIMILVGKQIKKYQDKISNPRMTILLSLLVLTMVISHFWRLDICFNHILPVIPMIIGAVAGSVMIFMFSSLISRRSKILSKVFMKIGLETFVVLAFSQIIIRLENEYSSFNAFTKYLVMLIILVALVIIKNKINNKLKIKIL